MNEELSENVALEDNTEEKKREVYRLPLIKVIECECTKTAENAGTDSMQFLS